MFPARHVLVDGFMTHPQLARATPGEPALPLTSEAMSGLTRP